MATKKKIEQPSKKPLTADPDAWPPSRKHTGPAAPWTEGDEVNALALKTAGSATMITVRDPKSLENAIAFLGDIADAKKKVEAVRVTLVKPLNDHVKRINEMFAPAKKNLDEADSALRSKVLTYRAAEQRKADEERAKLLADARKAQKTGDDDKAADLATEALAVVAPARLMVAGVGNDGGHTAQVAGRKTWTFKVTDAGKVPDEFWTLDESKLRASVRAGTRKIPGCHIFEEESLVVGGR